MKRLVVISGVLVVCAGTSAFAAPSIEFSPDAGSAGGWTYDGASTLSFNQYAAVDAAMSSNADALVGGNGFSGAKSNPEPAAVALLSLGSPVLWRKRSA